MRPIDDFLVGGIEHFEGGHDLAGGDRHNLQAARRHQLHAFGEEHQVVGERALWRKCGLHLHLGLRLRRRAKRRGEHAGEQDSFHGSLLGVGLYYRLTWAACRGKQPL
jgi:hypothetical protein